METSKKITRKYTKKRTHGAALLDPKSETRGVGEGNTNQSPPPARIVKKRSIQRLFWCFTWFYENDGDLEILFKVLQGIADRYIVGEEICPTTGKKHAQGFMALKEKARFEALIKVVTPAWHVTPCKGSEAQNVKYCTKEGKYHKWGFKVDVEVITELRPWQQTVIDILKQPVDKRAIHWFYDKDGKKGKSELFIYLIKHFKCIALTGGKKADIINVVFNQKEVIEKIKDNIFAIDVPRSDHNAVSYQALEEIKNGCIINTKYEGGSFIFNKPHIIVFSNFYPQKEKLSSDRWRIYHINKNMTATLVDHDVSIDENYVDEEAVGAQVVGQVAIQAET